MRPAAVFLRKHATVVLACSLWLPAAGYGITRLWRYAATPGNAGAPLMSWPDDAPVHRQRGHFTMLLFAHPQCPCTRATIRELSVLMTRTAGRLDTWVLSLSPSSPPAYWTHSDLLDEAGAIPGVKVLQDPDGTLAKQFGAATSGQVLLYKAGGRLRFQGGITASRGHSGDNAGRSAIIALLHGEQSPVVKTPVFGCSLRGE